MDPALRSAREGDFIASIIDSKRNSSKEMFDTAVGEYTRITPFHKTETAILATIADSFGVGSAPGGAGKGPTVVKDDEEFKLDDDQVDDNLAADFS